MKETKRRAPRTKAGLEAERVARAVAKRHHAELLRVIAEIERTVEGQGKTLKKIIERLDAGQKRFAAQDSMTIKVNSSLHSLSILSTLPKEIREVAGGLKDHVTDQVGTLRSEFAALARRVHTLEEARFDEAVGRMPAATAVASAKGNGL